MTQTPEIIAHRGASHLAPENTLASVNLAWTLNADAVEIDIHLTKDHRLVVMHDDDTARTTGKACPISQQTLDEIRQLDAGSWHGPEFVGEKVPMLEEVLATIPDGKRLFIEIKGGPEVVDELRRVLLEAGKGPEQIVIISFSLDAVRDAKISLPEHETSWLWGFQKDESGNWTPTAAEFIEKVRTAGVDGLDLEAGPAIDEAFVSEIEAAGLKLYTWTVDSTEEARRLADLGVDGITTNQPDVIMETLRG